MSKKIVLDKINGTKKAFLSRAPTRHSFTFNLRFSYELKHKVYLGSVSFLWKFIFMFNKMHGLFDFKSS